MSKRTTIYFDPELHRALWLKAMLAGRSMSDLVNEAVRHSLADDAEGLAAAEERTTEPDLNFEEVVQGLRACGKL